MLVRTGELRVGGRVPLEQLGSGRAAECGRAAGGAGGARGGALGVGSDLSSTVAGDMHYICAYAKERDMLRGMSIYMCMPHALSHACTAQPHARTHSHLVHALRRPPTV